MWYGSSWAQSLLLPMYYYGTWPCRRIVGQFAAWAGKCPIVILFYHRVADSTPTPWTISNRDFRRHVNWLSQHCEVISLREAQQRVASGYNARPAACITFDDGYAENCEQALPLLIARRLPVTYFVASDFVLQNKPFPHDAVRGQPLPPNSIVELRSLAAAGVEIGAHSRSHADLARAPKAQALWQEIAGSRDDLQQAVGTPVRYFSFPYGQYSNLSPAAFQVARDAGLAGVCSAYGGYNFPGSDAFHLQRLHGDPAFLRFKNWLSVDPRIATGVRRFPYESVLRTVPDQSDGTD